MSLLGSSAAASLLLLTLGRPFPCLPQVPSFALPPQPFQEGKWKLQDGLAVGAPLHETLTDMLTIMNKAVATLPNLLGARRRRGRARQRRRLSAVDDGSGGGESGGGGSGGGGLGWLA